VTRLRLAILAVALTGGLPAIAAAQKTAKTAAATPPPETQAQLQQEAKITLATASATALKEVPGGKQTKEELARKKGKVVYAFTLTIAGKPGTEKVDIDASTGALVSHTHKDATSTKKPGPTTG
jgi:uncharacterized membrane protein YkoI